jgi:hypothetical protein
MKKTRLKPSDVEWFLMSIHPADVPPELVADMVPHFLGLRIPPAQAVKLMQRMMRVAMQEAGWVETLWHKAEGKLCQRQGWHSEHHWAKAENRRTHIDATVERYS